VAGARRAKARAQVAVSDVNGASVAPPSSLARDFVALTRSSVLVRIGGFALSIINRRLLGPSAMGTWNYVDVMTTQLSSVTLGVHYAADRLMPIARARGETDEERRLQSLTMSYLIVEGLALAAGYGVWLWARHRSYGAAVLIGLALVPYLLLMNRVQTGYQVIVKNRKAFVVFASLKVWLWVINASMTLFILAGGVGGVYVGLLVTSTAVTVLHWWMVRRHRIFEFRWRVRLGELKATLGFGVAMGVWGLLFSLLQRGDSLFISATLGTTALGLYYLGPQLAATVAEIPTAVSVISYPNLMEVLGRDGLAAVVPAAHRYTRLQVFAVLPLAVSLAYFSIEFLISYFLPAFRPGIEPVRISLLTVLFWQAGGIYGQIVYATKRIVPLIAIAAASLAAVAAALYWQARAGTPTLAGVAWTIVAGHSLYFVLVLTVSYWLVYGRLRDGVRERLPVLAAPLVAVALMRTITTLTGPLNGASWIADLAKGAGQETLFLVCGLALLWVGDRSMAARLISAPVAWWRGGPR